MINIRSWYFEYYKKIQLDMDFYSTAIECLFRSNIRNNEEEFREFVILVTAPLLMSYVLWVLQSALESGNRKIFFLSRDGYIMYKIAQIIVDSYSLNLELKYLFCSRLSLRKALLHVNKDAYMSQLSFEQLNQTIEELNIHSSKKKDLKNLLEKSDFDWYYFFYNCGCLKVFEEHSYSSYKNLFGYLNQEGFLSDKKSVIVDSGWKGTMQENLKSIINYDRKFGHIEIEGYYFGIQTSLETTQKYSGFYYDSSEKSVNRLDVNNNVFEAICSANHGMTIGYEFDKGNYLPIHKEYKYNQYIESQKLIIEEFVKTFTDKNDHSVLVGIEMSRLISPVVKRVMLNPFSNDLNQLMKIDFDSSVDEKKLESLARELTFYDLCNYFIMSRLRKNRRHGIYWLAGSLRVTENRLVKIIGLIMMKILMLYKKVRLKNEKNWYLCKRFIQL
jgi:hypothetical protein